MNQIKTIAKNAAFLMAAQVIVLILGMVFVIYLARFLGTEGFGKYSFAIAFTGLFVVFADFGLSYLTIREVARNRDSAKKYIINTGVIKIILSIITFILILTAANLMHYPSDTTYAIYIFALYYILTSFSQVFRAIFQAFEVMEYESLIQISNTAISTSIGLFVIFSEIKIFDSTLIAIAFAFLIAGIFNLLFSFLICAKKILKIKIKNITKLPKKIQKEIDLKFWKYLIKEGAPFAIQTIFGVIYFGIDIVMLSIMQGDEVVGVYSAAFNLIAMLLVIPGILITVIFPVMSKFFVSSNDSLKITLEKSIKYVFIIGFPIAVGTTLLAEDFILLLYKEEFLLSIIALQILIWDIPFRFINYITSNNLAAINKAWIRTYGAIACAFFNIFANLILIPIYSFKGAAIATILTEILLFAIYLYFVRKHLYKKIISLNIKTLIDYSKIILCGIIMGGFIYFVKSLSINLMNVINLIAIICISALIYFAILYLLKGFSQDDKTILKSIMHR